MKEYFALLKNLFEKWAGTFALDSEVGFYLLKKAEFDLLQYSVVS